MPVSEIVNTHQALPTALQGRDRNPAQPVQPQAANVNPATLAATAAEALTPTQQAALQINEVLQELGFERPGPRDAAVVNAANPLLAALDATQELTPAQQAALLINETLLNLSLSPANPADALLLNETSPIVEASEVTAELTPAEQAAELVNRNLRDLGATPPALTLTEVTARATTTAAGAPLQPPPGPEAAPTLATPFAPAGVGGAEGTAPGVSAVTLGEVTPTPAATVVPGAITALPNQNFTAATQPRDPTPFAFAVYEIKDQHPAPAEPKPPRREVAPPLPPGRVRPVDRLVLKREWERRHEHSQQEAIPEGMGGAERSIRQVISQANDDLLANGLPLRLVLGLSSKGYTLDIYDCSYDDMCRLAKEVPLDLKELATLLDNIQHESGIIINLKT